MNSPSTSTPATHLQKYQSAILDKIVVHKQKEVALLRDRLPITRWQEQVDKSPPVRDFLGAIGKSPTKPALIAEVKKASPSKGVLRADFDAVAIAQAYERGGATCISVLCDRHFFQGGFHNLIAVRKNVSLPLLCKEFIIDIYQIIWARAFGADAVLLLATILSDRQLQLFLTAIHELGMEALIEVRTLAECDRVLNLTGVRLLGINNRNLGDFTVDVRTTGQILNQRLGHLRSRRISIVSESGLSGRSDLDFAAKCGANAVLMGESLIKQTDVEAAVKQLMQPSHFE